MTNALAPRENTDLSIMEQVIIKGDLAQLQPQERVQYYNAVCQSVGLNPLSRPFDYISLNGKLTLYAKKDATDQLRKINHVSIDEPRREVVEGVYVVTTTARTSDGRTDTSIGAVNIEGLKGEAKANAMMKAETKSKRRVTLSICGLGWLDETEVESVPQAQITVVDTTGEIVQPGASFDPSVPQPSGRPTGPKITNKATAVNALLAARDRCEQLVERGVIHLAGCDEETADKYDRAATLNPNDATPEQIQRAANWLNKFANANEQQAQDAAAVEA
jgi:hypothetical protein